MHLEQLAQWVAIIGGSIPIGVAIVNLYSRLRVIESTISEHAEKHKGVDGLMERLGRIETKLDILMEERRH